MKLNDFLNEIRMLPEAVDAIMTLAASGRITEEEYEKNKMLYRGDRQQFYLRIQENKDYRLLFLYYFCRMGTEAYEEYEKRGIGKRIFRDTFYDLTLWCENCFREYGEYGINEYDWFFRHLQLTIFRLGRLEFEKMPSPWEFSAGERKVEKGENVISIHIPQGEKLTPESVKSSLEQGQSFWGRKMLYVCHSWLLYPELKDVLSPRSNILQFQKEFLLVDTDFREKEAEWRIFGRVEENPEDYPEETSLQKNAKKYLLTGKRLGNGLGVLKGEWCAMGIFRELMDKN